ncbi:MAG: hypothetical protein CLLPBCKN_006711 [Chroococcidiopsis cubana SAG 39.79]|uniref:Phasin domain-containing protein n=1 Tax=Chroococcidiopsis cubana SAG 39.79 TaxID=388085 RepID=A0AB37U8B6_9CYAN|nr:hypothetical protein [Chroococcidiopsis cubana]MDZ4877276.1 hypothetical protein [Chroococcidiopsis cubana SAG 39.79]PSB60223.1 hypothetical protein C7B79_26530 [Chroococcidiopsis cubana CCALA 043]RUS94418.1 hypothetical protein DSM107010_71900 [Chroococcidiopsis cubana SAG 39.79]
MANTECEQACRSAYTQSVQSVARLSDTLFENIVLAKDDESKKAQAKTYFNNGMKIAEEVRKTCLAQCGS